VPADVSQLGVELGGQASHPLVACETGGEMAPASTAAATAALFPLHSVTRDNSGIHTARIGADRSVKQLH
jgi:hypothetical protein